MKKSKNYHTGTYRLKRVTQKTVDVDTPILQMKSTNSHSRRIMLKHTGYIFYAEKVKIYVK